MHRVVLDSPIGPVVLEADDTVITCVRFGNGREKRAGSSVLLNRTAKKLASYFDGNVVDFADFPLRVQGPDFRVAVWEEMQKVPFGLVTTYRGLASTIGNTDAVRAVGSACRMNPFVILIPCHRVVPSDLSLGNYSAGVKRKKWLLEHEEKVSSHAWTKGA